jgi:hypothetical protein
MFNNVACIAVDMQRPRDGPVYVAPATESNETVEEMSFICGPRRDIISKRQGQLSHFCTGVSEEKTCAGGKGITIVRAVTRERLLPYWER